MFGGMLRISSRRGQKKYEWLPRRNWEKFGRGVQSEFGSSVEIGMVQSGYLMVLAVFLKFEGNY